jgi:hypothetical protein
VAERVRVRDITNDEGNRLLRIVRRSSGSVVTWRRAQMVLLSAQGMDVPAIAKVTFTSHDRVRDVLHNFNLDGFDALYPARQAVEMQPRQGNMDTSRRFDGRLDTTLTSGFAQWRVSES